MRFKTSLRVTPSISSMSMSDIVFSLMLFFLLATVIREYSGLPVTTPEASNIERLSTKTHTAYIWIDKANRISFNDKMISSMDDLYAVARQKIEEDNRLLVFIHADKSLKMGILSDVQEQLRRAGALRIYYATDEKSLNP